MLWIICILYNCLIFYEMTFRFYSCIFFLNFSLVCKAKCKFSVSSDLDITYDPFSCFFSFMLKDWVFSLFLNLSSNRLLKMNSDILRLLKINSNTLLSFQILWERGSGGAEVVILCDQTNIIISIFLRLFPFLLPLTLIFLKSYKFFSLFFLLVFSFSLSYLRAFVLISTSMFNILPTTLDFSIHRFSYLLIPVQLLFFFHVLYIVFGRIIPILIYVPMSWAPFPRPFSLSRFWA